MSTEWIRGQVERLLRDAEESLTKRDWQSVAGLARDILALDPDNGDGQGLLAAASRALGNEEVASPAPAVEDTSHPEYPASFANGRYETQEFLGEGGKKRVYLAHDAVLDRDVALAIIKTEGLDESSRTRVTREAQAMGRLGDHPHILPIHDLGEEKGQPYMVLPLMPGGDVEGLLTRAEDHRLALEQAIDLAIQVCLGLEHAHSHGVVHRDLKPGNVWLTADGTAKIGDFGLAVSMDRSRLTQEGMMVGTVFYMPPEQALGGEVTPQADLYSLGAMLYEMVTGRPPFMGDDSVAIIGQHINTPPVAPSWHNPQCSRPLEALMLRLLAKDPAERPESAADVLAALQAIDLAAPVEEPALHEAHVLDSLAGGVFVGRQREMGELKAALEDALSGRGRLMTLVGEPGIGKTRTALELATYAGLRHVQVLWGRCYEAQGAPPYWPWVQAIRSYVRERDPQELRSEMGAGAADIAEILSDVRERLPGLAPPPALEPDQSRFRLFDSITTFLKAAGRREPLLLILEDLHWADRPSLLLLEFVARELAGARLLLIGTYRDVEVSRGHPLSQTLAELTRERLFQRALLRGLNPEDVGRFIEIVSGVTPPARMVEAVHRQTEGNPLFVTEVVRLLVQEGQLTPDKIRERQSWTVRIPEGVKEVIGRRLDRLSERCNQTLTIASVVGREFSLEQMEPLIEDLSGGRLLDVVEEALGSRVIEELPHMAGRYQFTHALIQETLADELSATRRVRLHARIGEALEELHGPQVEAHAAELAHHYAAAVTVVGSDKVVHYSSLAGERALAAYAYEEALGHFERALAAKEGQAMDAETAALLFGLGRAQGAAGQMHDAWATLERAFEYYSEAGDVTSAIAVAEHPLHALWHPTGAAPLMTRALELVPPDSETAGRFLSLHGRVLGVEEGDYEGAQQAFNRAMAIAQREEDSAVEMWTLANAAVVDLNHLRWQETLEKSLKAIELAQRNDDPRTELNASYWAAAAQCIMGDLEEARSRGRPMLVLAEQLRDRTLLASAAWNNEVTSSLGGAWQAAREFSDRGLGVGPTRSALIGTRVLLEYTLGDFGPGEARLEQLLEVMRLTPRGPGLEYAFPAMVIPAVCRITGVVSQFDVAEAAAEAVLTSPSATPIAALYARVGLSLIAVHRGDLAAAEEQRTSLGSQRGTILLGSPVAADRLLGLLAQTIGNLDDAMVHFEDALVFCRRGGARAELAWTCCDYADLLKQHNAPGDNEKALSLLDESLTISRELGMRPLMERVLARRGIITA